MLHEMLKKFFLHDSQSLSYPPLKLLPNTKRFVVRLLLECGLLVLYLLGYCLLRELPHESVWSLFCYLYYGVFTLYILVFRLYLLSKETEYNKRIFVENTLFGIFSMLIILTTCISDFLGENSFISNVKTWLTILGIIYMWFPLPKITYDKYQGQLLPLRRQCFVINMLVMMVLLFVL